MTTAKGLCHTCHSTNVTVMPSEKDGKPICRQCDKLET
jgi:hypothetical protein